MKLLFLVTGIGYGDATREHSNIIAIKKKYPKAKILIACYDNSYQYFKDKYPIIKVRGYKLPGDKLKINLPLFTISNIFLPAFWGLSTLKVRLQAHDFIPDLVITDFEPAGISLAKVLGKKCIALFGFDPEQYKEYKKNNKVNYKLKVQAHYFKKLFDQADLAVIPSLQRRKKKLRYTYINPIIRFTPDELQDEKTLMKEFKLKNKPILVMLGGSNFGTELTEELNKISKSFKEEFIVFGGHLQHTEFAKNVKYIRYTSDFLKYLKVCKGVITLAGQKTLSEAMIYKKPVLCFPIQDHIEQLLNSDALKDFIMVSHSTKNFKKTLKTFIKDMPTLQRKVNKYDLKPTGSQQFLKLIEIALQE